MVLDAQSDEILKCDIDEIVQCDPTTIRPVDENCLYPPEQPKIIARMCEYLLNEKKILLIMKFPQLKHAHGFIHTKQLVFIVTYHLNLQE